MPSPKAMVALAALAALAGATFVAIVAAGGKSASQPPPARELVGGVWVSGQVTLAQLAELKARGFKAVIDLRPDGEARDQPSAADMAQAAHANGMAFVYIPVPHGDIPAAAVDNLGQALVRRVERPVVLYCRSGWRAARTWALAEASRPAGLDAAAIKAAVQSAGQPVDNLDESIAMRIAARSGNPHD